MVVKVSSCCVKAWLQGGHAKAGPTRAARPRARNRGSCSVNLLTLTAITVLTTVMPVLAQTMPNLKGSWSGPWKSVVYGNNPHHPGHETHADSPRIREITFTFEIQGNEGRMFWGQHWSNNVTHKEPFAAVIMPDGKTIVGSDTDGSFSGSITAPDRIELCYAHTALSPSKSIVAGCGTAQRAR